MNLASLEPILRTHIGNYIEKWFDANVSLNNLPLTTASDISTAPSKSTSTTHSQLPRAAA